MSTGCDPFSHNVINTISVKSVLNNKTTASCWCEHNNSCARSNKHVPVFMVVLYPPSNTHSWSLTGLRQVTQCFEIAPSHMHMFTVLEEQPYSWLTFELLFIAINSLLLCCWSNSHFCAQPCLWCTVLVTLTLVCSFCVLQNIQHAAVRINTDNTEKYFCCCTPWGVVTLKLTRTCVYTNWEQKNIITMTTGPFLVSLLCLPFYRDKSLILTFQFFFFSPFQPRETNYKLFCNTTVCALEGRCLPCLENN